MSVPAAYLGIILIWSTTPLAIQWSTQGTGFAFAVFARMLIGFLLATLIVLVWRIGFPRHGRARRAYLLSGLSLFAAMALTYWGARHIHSGLVSVLFGLSPLMASVMAHLWLGEKSLGPRQIGGMLLALGGLAVIFLHGGTLGGPQAIAGLAALLAAVFIYSAGLVGLKRIGDDSPPLATTVGALGVALPLFAVLWWSAEGSALPATIPPRALAAIAYLGVFGSVIGFALYYYVIKHLDASRIALITLMTPVVALLLGHWLNGETVGLRLWIGTAMILGGLSLHQGAVLLRALRLRMASAAG